MTIDSHRTGNRPAAGSEAASHQAATAGAAGPRLTVVVETVTPGEYEHHGWAPQDPGEAVGALSAQGPAPVPVVLMVDGPVAPAAARFAGQPNVRALGAEGASYYEMKNAGARAADTEYVGFLDADCTPCGDWVARAVAALDAGADVVAGRSRYRGPGLWAMTMTFFDFGGVGPRADGTATQFHLNNVAFRRYVLLAHPLDTRLKRSGACYLAAQRLRADGRRMVYVPGMQVTHGNDYRVGAGFFKRLRNGHDAATLRAVDDTGALPYRWIARLGPAGAPLVAGRRIWDDWVRLARRHGDIGIPHAAVPFVALVSIPMRLVEGGAYALSCVRPSVIGRYWG